MSKKKQRQLLKQQYEATDLTFYNDTITDPDRLALWESTCRFIEDEEVKRHAYLICANDNVFYADYRVIAYQAQKKYGMKYKK